MITTTQAIQKWKDSKLTTVLYNFYCGGDSMGDSYFEDTFEDIELERYLEHNIYLNITFYKDSDGFYMGEFGIISITINKEADDFCYEKKAKLEYNDEIEDPVIIQLSSEAIAYIKANVTMISEGGGDLLRFTYTDNFVKTCDYQFLENYIVDNIYHAIDKHVPDQGKYIGELLDNDEYYYRIESTIECFDDYIKIMVKFRFQYYEESIN